MTLLSMTGFGRAELSSSSIQLTVEVKTVNSRYLDLSVKLPPIYSSLESLIVERIKARFNRGRVELYLKRIVTQQVEGDLVFGIKGALITGYTDCVVESLADCKLDEGELRSLAVRNALGRKEFVELAEVQTLGEEETKLVLDTVSGAVDEAQNFRISEGKSLVKEMTFQLKELEKIRGAIEEEAGKFKEVAKKKVQERLSQLLDSDFEVDEGRVAMELAVLLEKADIREEIVRFKSHLEEFNKTVEKGGVSGRRMDFLTQELNREINTIGSKSQQSCLSLLVVEAKSTLEKLREQLQNVE